MERVKKGWSIKRRLKRTEWSGGVERGDEEKHKKYVKVAGRGR